MEVKWGKYTSSSHGSIMGTLGCRPAPDSCLPPQSYGSAAPSYRSEGGLETTDSASTRSSWGHFNKTLGQMSGKTSVKSKKFKKTSGRNTVPLSLHKLHQLLSLFYPVKTYRGFQSCRETVPSREFNPNQDLQLMNASVVFLKLRTASPI